MVCRVSLCWTWAELWADVATSVAFGICSVSCGCKNKNARVIAEICSPGVEVRQSSISRCLDELAAYSERIVLSRLVPLSWFWKDKTIKMAAVTSAEVLFALNPSSSASFLPWNTCRQRHRTAASGWLCCPMLSLLNPVADWAFFPLLKEIRVNMLCTE